MRSNRKDILFLLSKVPVVERELEKNAQIGSIFGAVGKATSKILTGAGKGLVTGGSKVIKSKPVQAGWGLAKKHPLTAALTVGYPALLVPSAFGNSIRKTTGGRPTSLTRNIPKVPNVHR